MSQAGHLSVAASPSVATSYVTDNGTAVPAANVLNILADDTNEDNINGIQTSGSGNTVTVQLTNRLQGTATVVGATTGDIMTYSLGAVASVFRVTVELCGRDAGTGDGVGYTVKGTARTDGATATIISTPNVEADEDASLTAALITIVASGNNIILRATGVAGQTINYSAVGYFVSVG